MWTSNIGSKVFTVIKAKATTKLQSKYPDINFTTSDRVPSDPKFPTVYVKRMQGDERGQDLEGTSVNAILSSFQIEVTSNISDTDAQEVADVVADIMKSMRYQMMGEPIAENTSSNTHRNVARYQRIVGFGDTL